MSAALPSAASAVSFAGVATALVPAAGVRLRILVVEDSPLLACGFRLLLGAEPWVARCVCAYEPEQAVERALRYAPHVVVVSTASPLDAVIIIEAIREASIETTFLLVAEVDDDGAAWARCAGADGVVSRREPFAAIAEGVIEVFLRRPYFVRTSSTGALLNRRERSTLTLIAQGLTTAEIAQELHVAPDTVKGYVRRLMLKLDVHNRAAAVAAGSRLGLIG